VFVALTSLMVSSVLVFHYGMGLKPIDAFYFMVTTLTTTGYGDFSLKDHAVWLKLYASLMMLLGSATIATVYSLITDFIVTARVRQLLGRKSVPERDHVVVVGLGNLGLRVIDELADHGIEVATIDRDAENPYYSTVQENHAIVTGDARMSTVLASANVATARAVLILTGDDAVNLSVALSAKELNPGARIVVRLFDAEFARKVEENPAIDAALGASRIAAPTFVASAMFPGVLKAFIDGDAMCVLLRSNESLAFRPQERPEVVWRGAGPAYEGNPRASGGIVAIWRPLVRPFEGQ
jgi:Trk K+ transport system NAD-binding subunit